MKPGDLVMTRNMSTGSGEVALVLKSSKRRFAVSPIGVIPMKYTTMETCDILWRGEIVDGIDTHFLRKIKQNETG